MNIDRLDPKAVQKISGPAWEPMRALFETVNDTLLDTAPSATGQLTTIYVKYSSPETSGNPYGVVWIKKATEIVVGLSLPDDVKHRRLVDAPKGHKYAGLTKYLILDEDNGVPITFEKWAIAAYRCRAAE